jgi:hypothetical protein
MGNGKTLAMTFYLGMDKEEGRQIITNYHTTFSELMTVKEMIDYIMSTELKNISIGIDEMQLIFNSLGRKRAKTELITTMITQTRKRKVDIYFTTQRWMLIDKILRDMTAYVIVPQKMHSDGEECFLDSCSRPDHQIIVNCMIPYKPIPLRILHANKVGQLYNSNEIIKEKFE